jgi:endonuclease/exonuclease/phosphatase family metal-dependent hydrolase
MKLNKKVAGLTFLDLLNIVAILILGCLYIGGRISPEKINPLWVFNFIIPFALILNIILLLVCLLARKRVALVYALLLVVGHIYLFSSFGFRYLFKKKVTDTSGFSVINYNVGLFQTMSSEIITNETPDDKSKKIISWVMNNDADIQCYQEFARFKGHRKYDFMRMLKEKGYYLHFSKTNSWTDTNEIGLLIASKFPIIRNGNVVESTKDKEFQFNRMMYSDLKINKDTVRVINVHLASMALKTNNPVQKRNLRAIAKDLKAITERLKWGAIRRSHQIDKLIKFIRESPYPVICVGDFNDLPYTYAYQQMKKELFNAFEERGKGFGFTYNGNTLRMLRIDNQFYSTGINSTNFETLYEMNTSDHFPVRGRYELVDN